MVFVEGIILYWRGRWHQIGKLGTLKMMINRLIIRHFTSGRAGARAGRSRLVGSCQRADKNAR
ncbi:MAG: hypothetical protein DWI67_01340 [Chloroflexi bacterium]|nr:MAG: hypothetical protein DWI67_01340 [Chloroflexota bacterium]